MTMNLTPITFRDACAFVESFHRHHPKPQGHKFSIGLQDNGKLIGVVMIGRPVARCLDDGFTSEVIRLCTLGDKNACSKLYSAAARASKEMGYRKIYTYILESESGISLKATGWNHDGDVKGRSWSCKSRKRTDKHPTVNKKRYIRILIKEEKIVRKKKKKLRKIT